MKALGVVSTAGAALATSVCIDRAAKVLETFATSGSEAALSLAAGFGTQTFCFLLAIGIDQFIAGKKSREEARALAEQLRTIETSNKTIEELLHEITSGKIKLVVTLDEVERDSLVKLFVEAQRTGHEQIVAILIQILELLGDRPAAPPPTSNLVEAGIRPNVDFVGRTQVLADLHRELTSSGNVALAQALAGDGGFGKTEIAKQYITTEPGATHWAGRWWIGASKTAVEESLSALARVMKCAPQAGEETPEAVRAAIIGFLRQAQGLQLVVFDNLDDADVLANFVLPDNCRVLATTRLTQLPPSIAATIKVEVLDRASSIKLLRKHRPDLQGAQFDADLDKVAEHLGDHALSIALAGAYLRKFTSVSPGALLERLQRAEVGQRDNALSDMHSSALGTRYERGVAETLSLHFESLRDTDAMTVLEYASFLAPDAIPFELLSAALGKGDEAAEKAVAALAEVSIVDDVGGLVNVHRLTQSVARGQLAPATTSSMVEHLAAVLDASLDGVADPILLSRIEPFARQSQYFLRHSPAICFGLSHCRIVNYVGIYLSHRSQFSDAIALLTSFEFAIDEVAGKNHPLRAAWCNSLGCARLAMGDIKGAMESCMEAESIARSNHGIIHGDVANYTNNVGRILLAAEEWDLAIQSLQAAKGIYQAIYGHGCPPIARVTNNIGYALLARKKFPEALACFEEALAIDKVFLGVRHPQVGIRLLNIGTVYLHNRRFDDAMRVLEESMAILSEIFGLNHPGVAIALGGIAAVLRVRGDADGASRKEHEAFHILLNTQGVTGIETLKCAGTIVMHSQDTLAGIRQITDEVRQIAGDDKAKEFANIFVPWLRRDAEQQLKGIGPPRLRLH